MKVSKLELTNIRGYENAQIEFSPGINIIVGENNSGKTTILRTLLFLQDKNLITSEDIRKNKKTGKINLFFDGGTSPYFNNFVNQLITDKNNQIEIEIEDDYLNKILINGEKIRKLSTFNDTSLIKDTEPQNFIYPFLSKRKVTKYNEEVGEYYANQVSGNLSNLYAKVDRISGDGLPEKDEYVSACEEILGFRISSSTANRGKKATYVINSSQNISLELMGEGVANIVGLILDLCMAKDKLFIIEEPETDIHPKALKKLLYFIIKKSHNNQFIITTHSNIVLKYLGSAPLSKIFHVKMEIPDHRIPTSSINEIDNSSKARREILENLGYELFDFDIWDIWLILEESSAEVVIRDFLIPNFVSAELKGRIKTCSSKGVEKVSARVEALHSLCLFLHLQDSFKDRIWVLIDGGEKEEKIVKDLKDKYKSWNEDRFRQLKEHDFEKYYPDEFQEEVDEVLKITDKQEKRKKKEALLKKVKQWWIENPEIAKEGFSKSAHEVIEFLINIEKLLSEYYN